MADSELDLEAILPAQFDRNSLPRTGEIALRMAILRQAIADIEKGFSPHARYRLRRLAKESVNWILEDCNSWPFSFQELCLSLGLDPAAVKENVLSRHIHKEKGRKRHSRILSSRNQRNLLARLRV